MQQNDKMTELLKKIAIMSLISSGLAFISLFIPIFSAFGGLFSMNLFRCFLNIFAKIGSLDVEFWDVMFWFLALIVLVTSAVGIVMSTIVLAHPEKKTMSQMGTSARAHFIMALIVFVFCLIYIFADGSVGGIFFFIFGGTYSWLFPIFHIIPLCIDLRYRKEYNKEWKDQIAKRKDNVKAKIVSNNENFNAKPSDGTNKATQTTAQFSPKPQNNNVKIAQQKEQIELLREYKTLLDSGIITYEEFDEKKNELLNIRSDDATNGGQSEEIPTMTGNTKESNISIAQTSEEKYYDVVISTPYDGKRKLEVIREIKDATNASLGEVKEIVENSPAICMEMATYDEASALKLKLEALGAKIEVIEHRP